MDKKRMDIVVKQLEGKSGEKMVVIKKVSFFAKLLEILSDSFYKIVRAFCWIIVCILITIGINTLLNGQMRQEAMNIFYQLIGG
jgi:membrane protein insertase Oxa1/YidC/SpoIIIJ